MLPRQARLRGYFDNGLFVTTTEHAKHPLRCRPNTSDLQVFCQVFIEREYACLDDVTDASLIIDCGANVGYSTTYFLSRFPGCDLIAVEPDPGNFQVLCLNLAPYVGAARAIQSAIWSHPGQLTLSEVRYRDGREWARQVRECKSGEDGFLAVGIGSLLSQSGHQRISILKMDIEGAEAVVFSENYHSWLECVDNLVIELHDDSMFGNATAVFANAMTGRGFTFSRFGELTVCKRRT